MRRHDVVDLVRVLGLINAIRMVEYVPTLLAPRFLREPCGVDAPAGVVALCSSTIFSVTYGFNAVQTVSFCAPRYHSHSPRPLCPVFQGLTNLGGIVGIVLAVAVSGPLIDSCVVWLSQRNRGIYEPEFRLVSMATMLFGVFGYIGWAVGNDDDMPWIGAVTCIAYV